MKKAWQKNTIVIIAAYSLDFLSQLKAEGKKPGAIRATLYKGTPDEKIYRIIPGKKTEIPVEVATEIEKYSNIASVVEVK